MILHGNSFRVTRVTGPDGARETAMDRRTIRLTSPLASRRAREALSLALYRRIHAAVAPIDAPEVPMVVSFEGLTKAEQQAALAAFPGGRRFVLRH